MARILIPLPNTDYDPSEASIVWAILADAGHDIVFATLDGAAAIADPVMLTGIGLDPWARLPVIGGLPLLGLMLRADGVARAAHARMAADARYRAPRRYDAVQANDVDALFLPGGHAKGMRPYLEDAGLQALVAAIFAAAKPVAAICHGVLLAARSKDPRTGRSVLHGRRTTGLTWKMERTAWTLTRGYGRPWDPDYYRTYVEGPGDPPGYWSVEAEVKRLLARGDDWCDVPPGAPHHFRKTSGLFRDRLDDDRPAFVVEDGLYLSARWPGDAHGLGKRFAAVLAGR